MIHIRTLPGPKTSAVLQRYEKVIGLYDPPYPFVYGGKGQGVYVEDLDGNMFMDWASQIAAQPLGYNHPRMVKVAQAFAQRAPLKLAGHDYYSLEHVELMEELASITPKELNRFFLINSGAEAVENAIKIAYRTKPTARIGISVQGAFHGRTLGALSLTNSKIAQKKNYPEIPMRRITLNNHDDLHRLLKHDVHPENVAFVIAEPIQGEGGYRFASKEWLKSLREETSAHHIPLIFDEIQTGLGRTGEWWAFEHSGVIPDIMTAAKGLQVGATIGREEFFPKESSSISSTWGGGDLIHMAMGMAVIRAIKEDKLLENCRKTGAYFLKRLQELSEKYPIVQGARGQGLLLAIDLPDPAIRNKLVEMNFNKGLITLGCGTQSLRLIPPLIISEKEVDEGMVVLEQNVKELARGAL